MSMSLEAVLNHGGYDISTIDDATWLLSRQSEFEELIEKAEEILEREENEDE